MSDFSNRKLLRQNFRFIRFRTPNKKGKNEENIFRHSQNTEGGVPRLDVEKKLGFDKKHN